MYLLVMPKYWGKQIFTHGSFPEVGEKQKSRKKKKKKKVGEKMASFALSATTCGARKHAWTKKRKSVKTMASYAQVRHHGLSLQAAWTKKPRTSVEKNSPSVQLHPPEPTLVN